LNGVKSENFNIGKKFSSLFPCQLSEKKGRKTLADECVTLVPAGENNTQNKSFNLLMAT
jgi:hypothetical protein